MSDLIALKNKSNAEILRLLSAVSSLSLPNSEPKIIHKDEDTVAINILIREIKEKLDIPQDNLSEEERSKFFEFISDEISNLTISDSDKSDIRDRLERKKIKLDFRVTIRNYLGNDKYVKWVAGAAILLGILAFAKGVDIFQPLDSYFTETKTLIEGIIALLNIGLAVFVIFSNFKIYKELGNAEQSAATKTYLQVLRGWSLLWFNWILLYSFLAWNWFHPNNESQWVKYCSDTFNLINGSLFYFLFFALDQPSVNVKGEPQRAKDFYRNYGIVLILGLVLLCITFFIDPQNKTILKQLCPAYTAVGMAFFFGRLDSHYLTIPRVVLAPLYFYAVIQLYWGSESFDDLKVFNAERISIFGLALVLKFVLFYVIDKLLKSDDFRSYLVVAEKEQRINRKDRLGL